MWLSLAIVRRAKQVLIQAPNVTDRSKARSSIKIVECIQVSTVRGHSFNNAAKKNHYGTIVAARRLAHENKLRMPGHRSILITERRRWTSTEPALPDWRLHGGTDVLNTGRNPGTPGHPSPPGNGQSDKLGGGGDVFFYSMVFVAYDVHTAARLSVYYGKY